MNIAVEHREERRKERKKERKKEVAVEHSNMTLS